MKLADALVRAWYAPRLTALSFALTPLSLLFGMAVHLRRRAFAAGLLRKERASVPVIVVGNISVGGTGKTPLVLALAAELATRGFHPAVVSRGTGGDVQGARIVARDDDASRTGDEPLLLARRGLVVGVARRRIDAARAVLDAHPRCDVLIADDGLQHYALARDVEIAVVDGERLFGNGWLLPAGPLREPTRRLREVDAIVVNASNEPSPAVAGTAFGMRLVPDGFVNLVDAERVVGPSYFADRTLHALAGIGHPERFFGALRAMGLNAVAHPFPDHHRYGSEDLAFGDAEAILMTEKDAVKCTRFADARCWFLRVRADLDAAFFDRVLARLPAPARVGPAAAIPSS